MCIWEREEMQDTMFELLSQLFPYITCSGMHGHESAFTAPVAVIWHLAWDLSSVIVSVLPERGSVKINMGGGGQIPILLADLSIHVSEWQYRRESLKTFPWLQGILLPKKM